MNDELVQLVLNAGLYILIGLSLVTAWRVLRGPDIADRLLASDLLTTLLVGIIIVISILDDTPYLVDIALPVAALSFIGIISIARYIREREVF
jgi:multisubunit Na+/H+ antiporter MnhF subunit